MEVQLPVLDTEKCRTVFKDVHDVYDTNICAGGTEGRDACQGDSGGPLMMERDSTYYCIGLVSWGIGCARKEMPGVYTRIQSYIEWIYNITASARHCRIPVNSVDAL
jgi:secreted trypsin-like serine protease